MRIRERPCLICGDPERRYRVRSPRGCCDVCRGAGQIGIAESYTRPQNCTACLGTGRCYRCRGKGVVVVPSFRLSGRVEW